MSLLWHFREFVVALLLWCGLALAAYLVWPRLVVREPEEGLDPGSLAVALQCEDQFTPAIRRAKEET